MLLEGPVEVGGGGRGGGKGGEAGGGEAGGGGEVGGSAYETHSLPKNELCLQR